MPVSGSVLVSFSIEENFPTVYTDPDRLEQILRNLLENAVKYGIAIDPEAQRGIEVEIAVNDGITITVTNRGNSDHITNALNHIDKLQKTGDPKRLYMQRIGELIEGQEQEESCQLGLFRIAYEGQFELTYDVVEDNLITIKAHREIA